MGPKSQNLNINFPKRIIPNAGYSSYHGFSHHFPFVQNLIVRDYIF